MHTVTLARNAMATRFEIVLHGHNVAGLRAAAEEALDEIERLESQLSLYRPSSEIARVNAGAGTHAVRVTPTVFALLERARALSQETEGAFDITVAPLVRCWGFMGETGRVPSSAELEEARACVGATHMLLDPAHFTVQFDREGVMLDLGAMGKGFAIERAATLLREAGVTSALLHGGTSTVAAIGAPPGARAWIIGIQTPIACPGPSGLSDPSSENVLGTVALCDEALSVSAISGKTFQCGGETYGHVIDPTAGRPVSNGLLAAVLLPSATETDAFSTALLTLGREGHDKVFRLRPGMKTILVTPPNGSGDFRVETRGIHLESKLSVEKRNSCD